MNEHEVWTSEPPTIEGEYRMRRDGVERVVKMVKIDGDWDAIGINMCWSWSTLSKHGAVRSAPIPPAEELAAMREVETAARTIIDAMHPRGGLDTSGVEDLSDSDWERAHAALSRLDAARNTKGASDVPSR